MASTYLSRSISSTGNRQKATFSAWVKRATASATNAIFVTGSGGERDMLLFESDGKLQYSRYNSSYIYMLKTNRQFRDTNAWYHIVTVFDSTESTSSDRMKIYVNGVQETSFNTANYPSQNYNSNYNQSGMTQYLGQDSDGNFDFDGCMSHVHYIDGTAYQASTFGSTDSTTGEWKINTSPSVTYGTNGFFLLKNDNAVTDRSGQGNNFTVGAGTLTKTEDSPSNVFATINSLLPTAGTGTYQSGNTYFRSDSASWDSALSTLSPVAGKYYFEVKVGATGNKYSIGAVDIERDSLFVNAGTSERYLGYRGMGYYGAGEIRGNNGSSEDSNLITGLTAFSNHIVGCAVDLDNNKMYWHLNGTYIQNGGYTQNPSTGSYGVDFSNNRNGTNAVAMGASSRDGHGLEINFGNGYFSSTAVSSAGTNASGIGIFEYDVPTGFTALSTKGLNL